MDGSGHAVPSRIGVEQVEAFSGAEGLMGRCRLRLIEVQSHLEALASPSVHGGKEGSQHGRQ